MIIQGYYNNKSVCKKDKVIVKYIPRSIYEEQLKPAESLQTFYKGMFEDILLRQFLFLSLILVNGYIKKY